MPSRFREGSEGRLARARGALSARQLSESELFRHGNERGEQELFRHRFLVSSDLCVFAPTLFYTILQRRTVKRLNIILNN